MNSSAIFGITLTVSSSPERSASGSSNSSKGSASSMSITAVVASLPRRAASASSDSSANEGLWLLDKGGTHLQLVHAKGYPDASMDAFRRVPLTARLPLTDAIRTGEPMWFDSLAASRERYPEMASNLPTKPASEAFVCLPLRVENRLIGALSVGFAHARKFSAEERESMTAMSRLCAQAMDRARLFEAEKEAHADAERATQARQDLLAIVSHDLRNPLSGVLLAAAQASRIAGSGEEGRRIRKYMDTIARLGDQMIRLVRDLLDLAKTEAGHLLTIERAQQDGVELVRRAVAALEPLAAARQLTLEQDLPPDPCVLFCDPDRIQQVFSNLIGNAIKFTREGGTVTVRARRVDGEIVFSVTDTGTGIPKDQIPHLFDPYWQPKAERRGLGVGLGLSVAKAIVQAHGGRLWVESAPGAGSTFNFGLPATAEAADSDEAPGASFLSKAEERHT